MLFSFIESLQSHFYLICMLLVAIACFCGCFISRFRLNPQKVRVKLTNRRKGIGVIGIIIIICAIGFLVLIKIPCFLEAQTRSKISRTKADMRSLSVALESYYAENDAYPVYTVELEHSANGFLGEKWEKTFSNISTFRNNDGEPFHSLTTPLAYIESYLSDPFAPYPKASYAYYSVSIDENSGWILWSPGPDEKYDMDIDSVKEYYDPAIDQPSNELLTRFAYDPTNGTISAGDVFRVKQ
jgi:Tfp pilus assembly protein PilE